MTSWGNLLSLKALSFIYLLCFFRIIFVLTNNPCQRVVMLQFVILQALALETAGNKNYHFAELGNICVAATPIPVAATPIPVAATPIPVAATPFPLLQHQFPLLQHKFPLLQHQSRCRNTIPVAATPVATLFSNAIISSPALHVNLSRLQFPRNELFTCNVPIPVKTISYRL